MKKIILAIILAASVGGCAGGFNPLAKVTNPVHTNNLYEAELVFDGSVKTFNTLKGLCVRRVIPSECRTYVLKGQDLIRKANAADKAAQSFVTNNPELDAFSVVQAFTGLVTDFKTNLTGLSALRAP